MRLNHTFLLNDRKELNEWLEKLFEMSDYRIQNRPSKSTHLITLPAVESVQTEFKDRFTDVTVDVLRQMQLFTPCFLLSDKPDIDDATINQLCTFYDLDSTVVARELA